MNDIELIKVTIDFSEHCRTTAFAWLEEHIGPRAASKNHLLIEEHTRWACSLSNKNRIFGKKHIASFWFVSSTDAMLFKLSGVGS